jgi:hypothetical protein
MGAVSVNQLTDMLSLVWRLRDDGTVVPEQVRHEELVEVLLVCLCWLVVLVLFIYLFGQILAHMHRIGETVISWLQLLQQNQKIGKEDNHLVG